MRHNAPHVLATTGLPHALIMALTPGDIDWDGRRVLAHPRRKGTGTAKVWLPVSAVAIKAWRVFVAAEAWGPYETSAFARTLRAAGWPADVRPYRLRSTVGIELSTRGVDLADVAGWLGHSDLDTTRADYVPVLAPRMVAAMQRLAGRVVWPREGDQGPVH